MNSCLQASKLLTPLMSLTAYFGQINTFLTHLTHDEPINGKDNLKSKWETNSL